MRDLAVLAFVTLDGVIQAPHMANEDRSGSFERGGWAAPYWDDVMARVERTALRKPYDLLLGRRTYDLFAGHWPNAPRSELSERLNAARKYVVTSSPGGLTWQNTHPVTGDIAEKIRRLKAQDGPLLQVHGSSELIQLLLSHDLIDVFRIWTFPTVTGPGKRLFSGQYQALQLSLCAHEVLENGVMMQTYRRIL